MHRITVIENFITPDDAASLIQQQLDPSSEKNPYPKYYSDRYGGTSLPYNKTVQDIMIRYGKKSNEMHKALNGFVNPIYVFKGFGSHWVPGSKGGLHHDAQDPESFIEFSTIIYLSDEKSYDGAGTEYIHGITTVTRGERFTALFMHTSLPQHADPDYHPNPGLWKAGVYPLARI